MWRWVLIGLLLLLPSEGAAQNWSGILSTSRAIDWSSAGASGLVTRTTVCASLSASATAAVINTAIQACPEGQVVSLAAGTYTIGSPGITFQGKNNVTLRGAGANSTFLTFTSAAAANCNGGSGANQGVICVGSVNLNFLVGSGNTQLASWTAGYSKGTTSITLSSKTNLTVGKMMLIGQAGDASDTGDIYVCQSASCGNGANHLGTGRTQGEFVHVTSISSGACPCTIGISPGVRMPNYRSGQTPVATWGNDEAQTGIGIENLSLDYTGASTTAWNGIMFQYATNSWVKGVRSVNPGTTSGSKHIRLMSATHITIRDSYFWGGKTHVQESYGIDPWGASDLLVENNIFQYITSPIVNEGATGNVYAYNFSIDDYFNDGTWAQASWYSHSGTNNFNLWESNDGFGLTMDVHDGPSFFNTVFRSRAIGKEANAGQTSQTVPIHIYAFSRYQHIIGSVLGDNAYHTAYQARAGTESSTNCNVSIYGLGWGGNCGGSGGNPLNDSLTHTTLMRWGNYDTVNDATRFVASEVPTGLASYANSLPASQALPSSFYLDGKPRFFGSQNWPAIGPDVTGGSESGVGGHNARIPARRCFEDVMGGAFGQRTTPRTFNPTTCYGTLNTYQAALCTGSTDHTKVQTQVDLAQDTDTVLIQAGNCNFGSTVSWTNKAITIRGAGEGLTNITVGNIPAFKHTVTLEVPFRLTGMTITSTNPNGDNDGAVLAIAADNLTAPLTSRWRVDHITAPLSGGNAPRWITVHGMYYGLVDHVTFTYTGEQIINMITHFNNRGSDLGAWACNNLPIDLGGDTAVYVEDSTFTYIRSGGSASPNDNGYCGRMVWRHNRFFGPLHLQTHSTRYGERGGIKSEYYNNYHDGQNHQYYPGPGTMLSGTGVSFNNTVKNVPAGHYWEVGGVMSVLELMFQRCPNSGCSESSPPFNYCSTSSGYDGGIESNGWPCLDQPGWVGAPQSQTNVPVYAWNNGPEDKCADPSAAGPACSGAYKIYIHCQPEMAAYVKTTPHSNGMKDYCAGTTSMPGSCGTHTNTYVPYTYPHPLQGGGAVASGTDVTPPAAPTGVMITKVDEHGNRLR